MSDYETWELPAFKFDTGAGHLSLNFLNSGNGRANGTLKESLHGYDYLIAWAIANQVVTKQEGYALLKRAQSNPDEAQHVYQRALAFREAFYLLLHSKDEVSTQALETVNQEIGQALRHTRLEHVDEHFVWSWDDQREDLDALLWVIVRASTDLLTSNQRYAVKFCGDPTCDWAFLDTTKNHSRRWCEMSSCGNRAKARRYQKRQNQNVKTS